jgi:5-methylcytosine-specific restriction endonuclease McrA
MSKNIEKRKEYIKEYQKNWMRERRLEWVLANGPCKHCGSSDNLEVDHINPALKTMEASSVWSRTQSVRDKELSNCQVLCKQCHLKKTLAERPQPTHGTTNMYNVYKCRCDDCKLAKQKKDMKKRNPNRYKELYGNE